MMDVRTAVWMGFLCTCMVATTVDSVIPPYILERAKIGRSRPSFRPTAQKCCRIGQRAAKKKLSCSAQSRQRTINRSIRFKMRLEGKSTKSQRKTRQLQIKITKCSKDHFKSFYKCCSYKERFYQNLKLCKTRHKKKRDRKKCKRLVRKKYS